LINLEALLLGRGKRRESKIGKGKGTRGNKRGEKRRKRE